MTRKGQAVIPFCTPWIGTRERRMVLDALKSDVSSDGFFSRRSIDLIREIVHASQVLLTTSCTHAMELALMVMRLQPGDEVLLPSFTFVSTANAVLIRGGRPVFVEVDEATLTIDHRDLVRKITPATVGVIPVHYAGICCDMDELSRVAAGASLWMIEDAAQAFGSRYKGKFLGTFGSFGCFSFHHTKNVVCGEGGALVTDSPDLFRVAEIVREKGTDRSSFLRREISKYSWIDRGSSYVLAEPLAALLAAQLMRIEEIHERRRNVYTRYAEALDPLVRKGYIRLQRITEGCEPNWHIFCFCVTDEDQRDRLLLYLMDQGIMASFHFLPLHASPYAKAHLGTSEGDLPVTERVAKALVRLPLFPTMKERQVAKVIRAVKAFYGL